MPGDGTPIEGSSTSHSGETLPPFGLWLILCRDRKLKCDRTKPRCNRCEKSKAECIYPESRRKSAFKRRNVRELEARLAQVEVLLKEAARDRSLHERTPEPASFQPTQVPVIENGFLQGLDFTEPDLFSGQFTDGAAFSFQQGDPAPAFSTGDAGGQHQDNAPFNGELMDLGGIFESLPPFEMMEDLNRIFFERQQPLIPIIHPSRYLQAFYSAPHMKPPMCLQYAIWALAASGHPKYGSYHDIFYRRARQYADSDEMKGYGEHFITVAHAQAWCVIATYEAKSMMFTRAAMSCARGVRLVTMMGLHRLDGAAEEISPTLLPPKDWVELEERRRAFWGVFCIDSHCSISTGWPHLIDVSEITTLLPAVSQLSMYPGFSVEQRAFPGPESAFHNGEPVETCSLRNAFNGEPYSSFAGAILVCHIFDQILKHVHKPKPNDHPDNYKYGEYWKRHREIDNILSNAFMNLPGSFRLPENYRDPVAVHTNLNLHASVICLHHSAIDRIDTYKLPESAKKISQGRLTTAAREIVDIIRLTSHVNSSPRSPLAALSLYCAASVFIYLCKETQTATHFDELDFIVAAMETLGRDHTITRAFLNQVAVDIEQNGIQHIARLRHLENLGEEVYSQISHNIPLLARCTISRHSQVQPPLPGRLPLGKPVGKIINPDMYQCAYGTWTTDSRLSESSFPETRSGEPAVGNINKRKRTSLSSGTHTLDGNSDASLPFWPTNSAQKSQASSIPSTHSSPAEALATTPAVPTSHPFPPGPAAHQQHVNLPHRTGSPAANAGAPPIPQQDSGIYSGRLGVNITPPLIAGLGPAPFRTAGRGPNQSQSTDGIGTWDLVSLCMQTHFAAAIRSNDDDGGDGGDVMNRNTNAGAGADDHSFPWGFVGNEGVNLDWGANPGVAVGVGEGERERERERGNDGGTGGMG
ncbi:hypothetical protein AAE478_002978 [Parahypoxylon ruwenzoriense]